MSDGFRERVFEAVTDFSRTNWGKQPKYLILSKDIRLTMQINHHKDFHIRKLDDVLGTPYLKGRKPKCSMEVETIWGLIILILPHHNSVNYLEVV